MPRVDGFEGTDTEYISYLERKIDYLEKQSVGTYCSSRSLDPADLTQQFLRQPATRRKQQREKLQQRLQRQYQSPPSPPLEQQQQQYRPNASPASRHSEQEDQLTIIPFVPNLVTKSKRLTNPLPRETRNHVDELTNLTPRTAEWKQAIANGGVLHLIHSSEFMSVLQNLGNESFVSLPHQAMSKPQTVTSSCGLERVIQMLHKHAGIVREGDRRANFLTTLTNFHKFLILSACVVIQSIRPESRDAFKIIEALLGSWHSDQYYQRLITTTRQQNVFVDTLNMRGWGNRTMALFLLWNKPPSFYCAITASPQGWSYLTNKLSDPQFWEGLSGEVVWESLFVPRLIENIFYGVMGMSQIASILGYELPNLLNPPNASLDNGHGLNPLECFGSVDVGYGVNPLNWFQNLNEVDGLNPLEWFTQHGFEDQVSYAQY